MADFQSILTRLGGSELEGVLLRHLDTAEELPLAKFFALAALTLADEERLVPDVPSLARLIGCSGMVATGSGIEIQRSEGSLRVDDVLVQLNGREVGDYGDACQALAGLEPGNQVSAQVLRNGRPVDVDLRLARSEELNWSQQRRLTLQPSAQASAMEKKVRRAVFGEAFDRRP